MRHFFCSEEVKLTTWLIIEIAGCEGGYSFGCTQYLEQNIFRFENTFASDV